VCPPETEYSHLQDIVIIDTKPYFKLLTVSIRTVKRYNYTIMGNIYGYTASL